MIEPDERPRTSERRRRRRWRSRSRITVRHSVVIAAIVVAFILANEVDVVDAGGRLSKSAQSELADYADEYDLANDVDLAAALAAASEAAAVDESENKVDAASHEEADGVSLQQETTVEVEDDGGVAEGFDIDGVRRRDALAGEGTAHGIRPEENGGTALATNIAHHPVPDYAEATSMLSKMDLEAEIAEGEGLVGNSNTQIFEEPHGVDIDIEQGKNNVVDNDNSYDDHKAEMQDSSNYVDTDGTGVDSEDPTVLMATYTRQVLDSLVADDVEGTGETQDPEAADMISTSSRVEEALGAEEDSTLQRKQNGKPDDAELGETHISPAGRGGGEEEEQERDEALGHDSIESGIAEVTADEDEEKDVDNSNTIEELLESGIETAVDGWTVAAAAVTDMVERLVDEAEPFLTTVEHRHEDAEDVFREVVGELVGEASLDSAAESQLDGDNSLPMDNIDAADMAAGKEHFSDGTESGVLIKTTDSKLEVESEQRGTNEGIVDSFHVEPAPPNEVAEGEIVDGTASSEDDSRNQQSFQVDEHQDPVSLGSASGDSSDGNEGGQQPTQSSESSAESEPTVYSAKPSDGSDQSDKIMEHEEGQSDKGDASTTASIDSDGVGGSRATESSRQRRNWGGVRGGERSDGRSGDVGDGKTRAHVSSQDMAQRVREMEDEILRKLLAEEEAKSFLDIWVEKAREYILTKTVPPTDAQCDFNWSRLRCEPKCKCGARLRFGDYTPGRTCRLLHPWERSQDCEDTWDPSDEPAARRFAAAIAGTLGGLRRAYDKRIAPPTNPECTFSLETRRCEPQNLCRLRFRWGDLTLSSACRLTKKEGNLATTQRAKGRPS